MAEAKRFPPQERTFLLDLATAIREQVRTYAYVHRHLLERIGPEATTRIWRTTDQLERDKRFQEILETIEWRDTTALVRPGNEGAIAIVRSLFEEPIRGVTADMASEAILGNPPFSLIAKWRPQMSGRAQIGTYDALHLLRHALALIAEETISSFGKAGELMIYDALVEELRSVLTDRLSAREFLRMRARRYRDHDTSTGIHAAGLDIDMLNENEREVIAHVRACEWARYYCDQHPGVGYLLACSLDNPAYRLISEDIRFQRRCTLMEGAPYCEFAFYVSEGAGREFSQGDLA